MAAFWPSSLPQYMLRDGYNEAPIMPRASFDTDVGGPIERPRGTYRMSEMQCAMQVTAAQLDLFEDFVQNDLGRGALPYYGFHPRKKTQVKLKLIVNSDGKPYSIAPVGAQFESQLHAQVTRLMSRSISVLSRREVELPHSGVAELIFVTVTHPETADIIRLVIDGADYLLNGNTYHASDFELDLLQDSDKPPQAPFRFPNVDRTAVAKLRKVNGPCRVAFTVYSSDYWDLTQEPRTVKPGLTPTPIYSAQSLFLTEVNADDVAVDGTLRSWDYTQESWPNKLATKALTPGAYAR